MKVRTHLPRDGQPSTMTFEFTIEEATQLNSVLTPVACHWEDLHQINMTGEKEKVFRDLQQLLQHHLQHVALSRPAGT